MKNNNISAIIAASVSDSVIIENTIKSILWVDEIIVVFSGKISSVFIKKLKKYKLKIYVTKNNLGFQRNFGVTKSHGNWILILDTDEQISPKLAKEIKVVINSDTLYVGYIIPYINYFLNNKVIYGNQKYSKLRFFKKEKGYIDNFQIHPNIWVKNNIGLLSNPIHHYSFRTIPQTLKKFSYYASIEAPLLFKKGDRVNLKKLTMYPAHMFYAIFFKDQGCKDGIWGFGLAICFAIMEFLKYWYLLGIQIKNWKILR